MTAEQEAARESAIAAVAEMMARDWVEHLGEKWGSDSNDCDSPAGRDDIGGGRALPARGPLDAGGEADAGGVPEAA